MTAIKPKNIRGSNIVPSAKAFRFGLFSFNQYDLSSDDEEYLTPNRIVETSPGHSDRATCLFTTAKLYMNSALEEPKNWGQVNSNLDDYQSDPMEISGRVWMQDITDWWHDPEEMPSKLANPSIVALDIFSIIPPCDLVEASFSLGRDFMGAMKSKTSGETDDEISLVIKCARANHVIFANDYTALHNTETATDLKLGKEAAERKFHRMAKVHDLWPMWQGSQNLYPTQKGSGTQNMQMTSIGYISENDELIKESWSNLEHQGATAFKL
jgi:hypothetical protein